jgi:hypothetical protein
MTEPHLPSELRAVSRLSSIFMVAGGALALIGGATHGDLPDSSGDAALRFLADHPAYALVHFLSIFGAVLWVLGINGWQATRRKATARWLARAGGHTALIGAAVLAVQFSLDGSGAQTLTAMWTESGASETGLETIAELAPGLLVGVALTWVMLLYGLPLILVGTSLLIDQRRVLGWAGLLIGGFAFVGGFALAIGAETLPDAVVFGGSIISGSIWVIATGIHTLREGSIRV